MSKSQFFRKFAKTDKTAGTYCEYGYACIENGTKCCPVGKWCPSWWPWKRDAKDNGVVAEAVDAGAA